MNNTYTPSVGEKMISDWVDIARKLEEFIPQNVSEENLDKCFEAFESLRAIIKADAKLKMKMRETDMGR